jgi:hypothetical protein
MNTPFVLISSPTESIPLSLDMVVYEENQLARGGSIQKFIGLGLSLGVQVQ